MKAWQMVRIEHEVKGVAWFKHIMRTDLDLPYGLAIAAGAVAAYPQTWWMKTLG
jgi:Flp pilus assembly protein protease CpaA